MKRSFKELFVFRRKGIQKLGKATVENCRETSEVEHISPQQIELIPCESSADGEISIGDVQIKKPYFIPVDLEMMSYLMAIPDFFFFLMEKARVAPNTNGIAILCSGSVLLVDGIPTYKVFIHCRRGQREADVNIVGCEYRGKLPAMYQMVYRLPQQDQAAA